MADELSIKVKAELDVSGLDKQIPQNKQIPIKIDDATAKTAINNIKTSIDALKKSDVILNLDVSDALAKVQSVADAIGNLNNLSVNLKGAQGTGGKSSGKSGGRRGIKRGTNGVPTNTSGVRMGNKYPDAFRQGLVTYEKDMKDKGATIIGSRISYNAATQQYEGLVKYRTELGKVTSALLTYNEAEKKMLVKSTSVTDNIEARAKAAEKERIAEEKRIESSKNFLSNQENAYKNLDSKAFKQRNNLTGNYAETAQKALDDYAKQLDQYKKDGKFDLTSALTGDQRRQIDAAREEAKRIIQEQQSKQYTPTDLSAKTLGDAISKSSSQLSVLENNLKQSGIYTEQFEQKISDLRGDLANVGKDGGKSIQEVNSQLSALKDSIAEYKSSTAGQADTLANKIDVNKLSGVDKILNYQALQASIVPETGRYTTGAQNIINELEALKAKYQEISTALKANNLDEATFKELQTELRGLDERFDAVSKKAQIFNDTVSGQENRDKANNKLEDLGNKLEILKQKYSDILEANPQLAARVNEFADSLAKADPSNVSALSTEFRNLDSAVKSSTGTAKTFSQIMRDSFGSAGGMIASYFSTYKIIQTGIRTIKNMVSEVKNLDTALVDLQKVTGLSGGELDSFADKAFDMGKEVGRTGTDVIDATATFSRAGYNLQESEALSKSALVLTNISGIKETSQAASDMISILQAYDIAAENSMDVVDKLYNIGNKEPIDIDNITSALVSAGGVLAQSGTTIEESAALITGGFATLRNASKVSTGLTTISQRLRAVGEDGEAIDGLMPKLEEDFNLIGSSITDENGNLRSTYDLLNDLAGAWDTLSSKQQQKLGEDIAGKIGNFFAGGYSNIV